MWFYCILAFAYLVCQEVIFHKKKKKEKKICTGPDTAWMVQYITELYPMTKIIFFFLNSCGKRTIHPSYSYMNHKTPFLMEPLTFIHDKPKLILIALFILMIKLERGSLLAT